MSVTPSNTAPVRAEADVVRPDQASRQRPTARSDLRECSGCGLIQSVPEMVRGRIASCPRCHTVLRRHITEPQSRALALTLTGLLLFGLATQLPFVDMQIQGKTLNTTLFSGPSQLEAHGMWELSIVVLITTLGAPVVKLLAMAWVLIGLRMERPPKYLYIALRWIEKLSPWSMVEVFLLGVFVAYTKLVDIAHVDIGGAVYALGALMLVMAAADSVFDPEGLWEALEAKGVTARNAGPALAHETPAHETPAPEAPVTGMAQPIGCDACGQVSWQVPTHPPGCCPRCGDRLHHRKPNSLARTAALAITATILYIPANILPVLTFTSFGKGEPSTILGGVMELAVAGMWPLAALVFFASITVPVLKLVSLAWLLISTRRAEAGRLVERTRLYRIVDAVGRWSMVDVFMISILTALVRLGALA
jgi:paraquat-inducible protein A